MYVCIYARICSYKYISTCDACVNAGFYIDVCLWCIYIKFDVYIYIYC